MSEDTTADNTPVQPAEPPSQPITTRQTPTYTRFCGARTRRGEPCRSPAMHNGRCRMHGGSTPNGLALPQTTHGRHSKYMPPLMREINEQRLIDADVRKLDQEIVYLDGRISELARNSRPAKNAQPPTVGRHRRNRSSPPP